MASQARGRFGRDVAVLVGDMERMPFASGSFDAAVTCWTLYFMRDIDAALAEIGRCLKPDGLLVAAANARDHMLEYSELAAAAVRAVLGRETATDIDKRFDIDSGGAMMRRRFARVELREWHGTMTLRSIDDVLALWHTYGDWSVSAEEAGPVLAELRASAAERLRRDGEIAVRRHGGAFVASDPR